jgi:hypothetical protein
VETSTKKRAQLLPNVREERARLLNRTNVKLATLNFTVSVDEDSPKMTGTVYEKMGELATKSGLDFVLFDSSRALDVIKP